MIDHDAARARAAAQAWPDSALGRTLNPWPDSRPHDSIAPSEPDDRAWMRQGACRGMAVELFFPDRGMPSEDAKATCNACPAQQQCLDYALAHGEEFGVWGGTSERERRGIRKALKLTKPSAPIEHGTNNGYFRHKSKSETPCPACTEAYRRHQRERQAHYKALRKAQHDQEAS